MLLPATLVTTLITSVSAASPVTCAPGPHEVTLKRVPVRCGPSLTDAVFAQATEGTMVEVVEAMPGWARISAGGPIFEKTWGIIRYPADEPGRFHLISPNEGRTNGTTDVRVSSMDRSNWSDGCNVCVLPPDTTVRIIQTQTVGAEITGTEPYTVHAIELPSAATGWILASGLRPVGSPAHVDNSTASNTPQWMMSQPTSPLANWDDWQQSRFAWLAAQQAEVDLAQAEPPIEEVAPPVEEVPAPVQTNPRWIALEKAVIAAPISSFDAETIQSFRNGYIAVIDEEAETNPKLAELAEIRLKQLELASSLNDTRASIDAARARMKRSHEDLVAQAQRLDDSPEYIMRGTLAVSPVFNGVDRPLYYRLKDPFSTRSLAYIATEDPKVDLRGMLGQRIGIVGPTNWNAAWNVMMVEPERIDLVSVMPPR